MRINRSIISNFNPNADVTFGDGVTVTSFAGTGDRMVIADEDGILGTQALPTGTVTSVATSAPLTGGTITSSGTIGITQATSVADGYLSSTDWTTFNGKQAALSGTGFVKISGTTISYDNSTYYLASNPSGYTTNTGTVTSVGLSTSTSGVTIASTPVTTSGTITVDIATASGSQNGLLSSTDFGTFNGKQAQLNGTGFVKASGTTISYDNTSYLPLTGGNLSGNLGVGYGTSAEQYLTIGEARTGNNYAYIDLIGDTTYTDYGARFIRYDTGANALTKLEHRGTGNFVIQAVDSADIVFQTQSANKMIVKSGGNLLVGTDSDSGDKLQVNGAIKTAAPTGYSAQPWKLGDYTAGGITTDGYILVEINGNLYTIPALAGLP